MRILLTGGAGFIGSHVADAVIDRGHSVAVIDDLSTGKSDNVNHGARFYEASVLDVEAVARVFEQEDPDVVIHHAAQTDVRRSMSDPAFDAMANILGTVTLLQACVRHKITRFIFASSSAVYSEPRYIPMDELHPIDPQSAYGISKYASEMYIRLHANAHGLKYKILRYGNVYGPRQNPKGEAGVVGIFCGQLIGGIQPTIYGDGTKTRDYVYVTDVADANIRALQEAGDNAVYNLASGEETSDYRIFEAIRNALGSDIAPRYATRRPGEAYRVCLDNSKSVEILDWRPTC